MSLVYSFSSWSAPTKIRHSIHLPSRFNNHLAKSTRKRPDPQLGDDDFMDETFEHSICLAGDKSEVMVCNILTVSLYTSMED